MTFKFSVVTKWRSKDTNLKCPVCLLKHDGTNLFSKVSAECRWQTGMCIWFRICGLGLRVKVSQLSAGGRLAGVLEAAAHVVL